MLSARPPEVRMHSRLASDHQMANSRAGHAAYSGAIFWNLGKPTVGRGSSKGGPWREGWAGVKGQHMTRMVVDVGGGDDRDPDGRAAA
jgi:hypothetical protein